MHKGGRAADLVMKIQLRLSTPAGRPPLNLREGRILDDRRAADVFEIVGAPRASRGANAKPLWPSDGPKGGGKAHCL